MNLSKFRDVDSYIAHSTVDAHKVLSELRKTIKSTIPQVEELIRYNVPFYKYYGEFVGFAVYKKHVSFGFGINVLQDPGRKSLESKGYTLGKGTLQIKFYQAVPAVEIKKILIQKAKMNEKGVK